MRSATGSSAASSPSTTSHQMTVAGGHSGTGTSATAGRQRSRGSEEKESRAAVGSFRRTECYAAVNDLDSDTLFTYFRPPLFNRPHRGSCGDCKCPELQKTIAALEEKIVRLDAEHQLKLNKYVITLSGVMDGVKVILSEYPELMEHSSEAVRKLAFADAKMDRTVNVMLLAAKAERVAGYHKMVGSVTAAKEGSRCKCDIRAESVLEALLTDADIYSACLSMIKKYMNLRENYHKVWETMASKVSTNLTEVGFIKSAAERPGVNSPFEDTIRLLTFAKSLITDLPDELMRDFESAIETCFQHLRSINEQTVYSLNSELDNMMETLIVRAGSVSPEVVRRLTLTIERIKRSIAIEDKTMSSVFTERFTLLKRVDYLEKQKASLEMSDAFNTRLRILVKEIKKMINLPDCRDTKLATMLGSLLQGHNYNNL